MRGTVGSDWTAPVKTLDVQAARKEQEITRLKAAQEEQEKELQDLHLELGSLRSQLEEKEDEYNQLVEQANLNRVEFVEDARVHLQEANNLTAAYEEESQRLEEENSAIREELENNRQALEALRSQVSRLTEEKDQVAEKARMLEKQTLPDLQKQMKSLEQEKDQAEKRAIDLESQNQVLSDQVIELETEKEQTAVAFEEELTTLRSQIQTLTIEKDQVAAEAKTIEEQTLPGLQQQIQSLELERNQVVEKARSFESQNQALLDQIAKLESGKKQLAVANEEELQALRSQVSMIPDEVAQQVATAKKELAGQLREKSYEIHDLVDTIQERETTLEDFAETMIQMKHDGANKDRQIQALEEQLGDLQDLQALTALSTVKGVQTEQNEVEEEDDFVDLLRDLLQRKEFQSEEFRPLREKFQFYIPAVNLFLENKGFENKNHQALVVEFSSNAIKNHLPQGITGAKKFAKSLNHYLHPRFETRDGSLGKPIFPRQNLSLPEAKDEKSKLIRSTMILADKYRHGYTLNSTTVAGLQKSTISPLEKSKKNLRSMLRKLTLSKETFLKIFAQSIDAMQRTPERQNNEELQGIAILSSLSLRRAEEDDSDRTVQATLLEAKTHLNLFLRHLDEGAENREALLRLQQKIQEIKPKDLTQKKKPGKFILNISEGMETLFGTVARLQGVRAQLTKTENHPAVKSKLDTTINGYTTMFQTVEGIIRGHGSGTS